MKIRVVIPTKDRPGNLSLAVAAIAPLLTEGDHLVLYDDGHRPATSDYGTRFALDIGLQLGAQVEVKRGKPAGIHRARAKMLSDSIAYTNTHRLLMLDDDILITYQALRAMRSLLDKDLDLQYSVPVIALSNNEAGVERFGDVPEATSVHDQQFVLNGEGIRRIEGGAWTCAIMFDLRRFNVQEAISNVLNGPPPAEDYRLTAPLYGKVDRSALVWHVMSDAQGKRSWNSDALQYLREMSGNNKE